MQYRLALIPLLFAALPAQAQNAARGGELAVAWCSACHIVAPDRPGGDVGPPFTRLALPEVRTDEELTGWLVEPHDPMPDFNLSGIEIDDIIAHIRSLAP